MALDLGPLELATTDELLKELLGRFDAAVFIGRKDTTAEYLAIKLCLRGDKVGCVGLCQVAAQRLTMECLDPDTEETLELDGSSEADESSDDGD